MRAVVCTVVPGHRYENGQKFSEARQQTPSITKTRYGRYVSFSMPGRGACNEGQRPSLRTGGGVPGVSRAGEGFDLVTGFRGVTSEIGGESGNYIIVPPFGR